jgi:RND family efflux transporter MFP subunit
LHEPATSLDGVTDNIDFEAVMAASLAGSSRPGFSTVSLRAAILLFAGFAAGCQPNEPVVVMKPVLPPAVTLPVVTAELHTWPRVVRTQGSLLPDEQAVVGNKVAGPISEVKVDVGSVVAAGQVLARLDTTDFDLRVQQSEAQLEQARARLGLRPGDAEETLDRLKAPIVLQEQALLDEAKLKLDRARLLVPQNAITTEELQQREVAVRVCEARYTSAMNSVDEQIVSLSVYRAELALARQAQSDAVITAPFDGLIQKRHVAAGVYLQTGQPVVTLVRTDPLRFRTGVPERDALAVKLGQIVHIHVAGERAALIGQISRISPSLDMASRALVIEVDLPNPESRLRVGVFAEAEIVIDAAAQTMSVPTSAVTEFAGVEKVWLVEGGAAREQQVATGRRQQDRVEILSGLSIGQQIAADGSQGQAGPVVAVVAEALLQNYAE